MRSRASRRKIVRQALLAGIALCVAGHCHFGRADEVHLQNGMLLRGVAFPVQGINELASRQNNSQPIPSEPYWCVDDGVRRYFVSKRHVQVEQRDDLAGVPEFTINRPSHERSLTPEVIGTVTAEPFSEFGRRTLMLTTERGSIPIIEQITRLRPDYVVIEAVTHSWTHGLDTRVLPPDRLNQLLHHSARPNNLDDLYSIVSFYIDAEMYREAQQELNQIIAQFPAEKEKAENLLTLVSEQNARLGMRAVVRCQQAGQHALAYEISKKAPPDKVSEEVLRQAQEIASTYDSAIEKRDRALMLLGLYESQIDPQQATRVQPCRVALKDELSIETIDRLEPFLRAESDTTLSPDQKLALAYSAWVVGPSFADLKLEAALNLWQARFITLEYLRCNEDPRERQRIVSQLSELEGATVERLAQLAPLLPYVIEERPPQPGVPRDYTLAGPGGTQFSYSVLLPLEYHSQHRYPLVVALRRSGQTPQESLRWWSGTAEQPGYAMRRGYIVISPQFADPKSEQYDDSLTAQRAVMGAINDVRKKFSVDSDRIFIAGHELGGDACYDIALAHPDVFAGAAPFLCRPDQYCVRTWRNGIRLPWYFVTGERDRDTLSKNAPLLNNLVNRGADVLYCEYKARGFESYFEELPRLFDWMDSRRRAAWSDIKTNDGWEMLIMRPTDDRYYWLTSESLPARLSEPIIWDRPRDVPQPMLVSSKILLGNSVYTRTPAGDSQLWLSPELIDFDSRLTVHHNGRVRFNDFVKPAAETLLEDLRARGDRQRLFWAKLDL